MTCKDPGLVRYSSCYLWPSFYRKLSFVWLVDRMFLDRRSVACRVSYQNYWICISVFFTRNANIISASLAKSAVSKEKWKKKDSSLPFDKSDTDKRGSMILGREKKNQTVRLKNIRRAPHWLDSPTLMTTWFQIMFDLLRNTTLGFFKGSHVNIF